MRTPSAKTGVPHARRSQSPFKTTFVVRKHGRVVFGRSSPLTFRQRQFAATVAESFMPPFHSADSATLGSFTWTVLPSAETVSTCPCVSPESDT